MFLMSRAFASTPRPPAPLPANTRARQLARGRVGYYWTCPTRDRRRGIDLGSRALGTDRAAAITTATALNAELQRQRDAIRVVPWPNPKTARKAKPDIGMLSAAA